MALGQDEQTLRDKPPPHTHTHTSIHRLVTGHSPELRDTKANKSEHLGISDKPEERDR